MVRVGQQRQRKGLVLHIAATRLERVIQITNLLVQENLQRNLRKNSCQVRLCKLIILKTNGLLVQLVPTWTCNFQVTVKYFENSGCFFVITCRLLVMCVYWIVLPVQWVFCFWLCVITEIEFLVMVCLLLVLFTDVVYVEFLYGVRNFPSFVMSIVSIVFYIIPCVCCAPKTCWAQFKLALLLFYIEVTCSWNILVIILPVYPKRHISIEVPQLPKLHTGKSRRPFICYNYCFYINIQHNTLVQIRKHYLN